MTYWRLLVGLVLFKFCKKYLKQKSANAVTIPVFTPTNKIPWQKE